MQIGETIAIFVIIAAVLMVLFCLTAYWFNRKLRVALQSQNEIYSLINGDERDAQCEAEGDYEDFVTKRIEDHKKRELKKDKKYQLMIEMTNLQEPFNFNKENIYSPSPLKIRLETSNNLLSHRSINSTKAFMPDKLETLRSNRSYLGKNKSRQSLDSNEEHKDMAMNRQISKHEFISKMIAYTDLGLQIVQIEATQVWIDRQNGPLQYDKIQKIHKIGPKQFKFQDTLEAYGFQKHFYDTFKITTCLQIPNMRPNVRYSLSSIKKVEKKQQMDLSQFHLARGQKYPQKQRITDAFEQQN